ncbi:hypothetical protein M0D68_06875 [Paraburkholderia sp. SEWSISQ10-3 4]|uniref:hypothetical protein n=1 Tax=Paraburkholderia TaxID=1822464 RepID=UPI00224E0AF1|nr:MULTISPECIES: hypothetical protein [Paraburkholderia]MCX4137900.1 hypothetical protein [Paraburkholderia aspalathi]MDN7170591.1 hypothetical protein [Paraburkholderia sp. SEWSISQ10-3 4]MDQ6500230.1 hypothetical protein [Paraburkholderia aspalathi]
MTGAAKIYVRDIYKRFAFLACWMPNMSVSLGDVGIVENNVFKQVTSLKNLGIPYTSRLGGHPADFSFTSESGVKILTKVKGELAAGTTLPAAKAGVCIQFSKKGGFIFQASDCYMDEIDDKVTLGKSIVELSRNGKDQWRREWCVIDTLVRAGSATIMVSTSAQAALELTAKAAVDPSTLAKLDAGFSVNAQSGDIVRVIAQKGLTPLFRLSRVKPFLLGLRFGGEGAEPVKEQDDKSFFDAVEPSDL